MDRVSCDDAGLQQASRVVRSGGLVVYPTDTVYGLGCDPRNPEAVKRVFKVKGRGGKALPVLFQTVEAVATVAELGPVGRELASRFWPGPLTIICTLKDHRLNETVALGSRKLGVRIPNHPCALKLIESCGGSLVGTSANRSGEPAPKSPDEAVRSLGDRFDLLIDGGPSTLGKESTVIDLSGGGIQIVREGYLSGEDLLSAARGIISVS